MIEYVALLLLLASPGSGVAQEAKVRASLGTHEDVWIGQRVTLVVELLVPGFFSGSPAFDLPDPRGVLIVPPQESPTVGSEDIGGTSYTVQRHEFSVFARRPGEQTIPSFAARFHFKRQPLDKDTVAATVRTEPLRFTVKIPPGADKLGGIISARSLTAIESWKPEPINGKVGDAFTRTIIFAAPGVPAMAFPPFPVVEVDGLGIYSKAPEVLDKSERGELRGERRDTITYVCQRPGQFLIPAIKLTWFDLDSQQLRTIDFPARMLRIAANPMMSSSPEKSHSAAPHLRKLILPFAFAAAAICGAWILYRNWERWTAPFRPVHLSPLNPPNQTYHEN
jgi:hypothetical protein